MGHETTKTTGIGTDSVRCTGPNLGRNVFRFGGSTISKIIAHPPQTLSMVSSILLAILLDELVQFVFVSTGRRGILKVRDRHDESDVFGPP